jgi:hypothetical protein
MQYRLRRRFRRGASAKLWKEVRARRRSVVSAIAVGTCLTWVVVTSSLPFALTESNPQLALWLDPANPTALVTVADRARARLLALDSQQESTAAGEADGLRHQIRTAVQSVIAADPLNAQAFRLLGELALTTEEKRSFMVRAISRSRREPIAVLWLMAEAFERQDYKSVIHMAEVLFRTEASLIPEATGYLAALAELPQGRSALAAVLAQQPVWRKRFLEALPRNVQYAGTPLQLFVSLNEAGSIVSDFELAPYLEVLIRETMVPYAHDIWLQLSPNQQPDAPQLLNNANFVSKPTNRPFDWVVRRGRNSTVEFLQLAGGIDGRAVQFSFDHGRVQFPELSQILVLRPGRYQLSGEFSGSVNATRGLRWEIRCWKEKMLAQTEMLFGKPQKTWEGFTLEVDVPDEDNCRAQTIRLFHDARSASEELISGQIIFRHLSIIGVGEEMAP